MAGIRDRMKTAMQDRTKEAYSRKDSSGLFKTYLDAGKLNGISQYKAPKGITILDIIPYEVGENDPNNKPGDFAYVLDVLVHMEVGAAGERIVCLSQYGLPCPVCEKIKALNAEQADYKTVIKPLVAKRRTLYNVIIRENAAEEKKGVQLFEMAHFFLEKNIATLAKNPRKGGYLVFSDPDTGKSISFNRTGTGADNTGYDAYQFVDRPEPITDEELKGARCLDDLLLIRDYDAVYNILHASPPGRLQEREEIEENNEEQEQEPEPPPEPQRRVNRPNPTPYNKPQEQEPEPKPTTAEERKAARKQRPTQDTELACPIEGGEFGKSCDEYDECDTCVIYKQCAAVCFPQE